MWVSFTTYPHFNLPCSPLLVRQILKSVTSQFLSDFFPTYFLLVPKKEHPHYRPNQPVSSHVPRSVLEAVASERLQVLAIPKPRNPLYEGFDPYKVSLAARVATASPRIQELSQPPARRCRKTSAQDE